MAESHGRPEPWLHVRREPFEYGLLPIPSLMHKEVDALRSLRVRLLAASSGNSVTSEADNSETRITVEALETCLKLPTPQARLVLDTLASILPTDNDDIDPLSQTTTSEIETVGADVDHILLFLFLQNYKRVPHRVFKDASTLGDVWPQDNTPFDTASSPTASALQLKTSLASRQRVLPGQADEEQHQLLFMQKHLKSLLELLSEEEEHAAGAGGEGTKPLLRVLSMDKFELLGLFLRVGRPSSSPSLLLTSVAPFFANSDPAMPAAPVHVSTAYDWLNPRLVATSESSTTSSSRSPTALGSSDVSMADAEAEGAGGRKPQGWSPAGLTGIDGVAKMSVLKLENEVDNGSVRVAHCHDSVVYVLSPLKYATVVGCSDSIIVLGPVGRSLKIETCERVQIIVPCARVKIANCRECLFYLGANSRPVILGDNHSMQVAPYNTFYPRLDYHLAKVGVDPSLSLWNQPLTLGMVDPHESSSAPAGASETLPEQALVLPPEKFVPFVVPFRNFPEQLGGGSSSNQMLLQQLTRTNPFALPKAYLTALQQKTKTVEGLRQTLKTAVLDESKKRELTNVIQAHFKEWLLTSGNIRQVYDLARLDRDP